MFVLPRVFYKPANFLLDTVFVHGYFVKQEMGTKRRLVRNETPERNMAKITTKQLDNIILAEKPVNMVDVAGDSGQVTILYRFKDHGRTRIKYREASGYEGVMELSSVVSLSAID
jgi:hypothetical protein